MLPQWHVKDPSHSAKNAGGRLHLDMHTPLTQQSRSGQSMLLSRHNVGTYPETSSHLSGNIWLQSSQLTEPQWTDPGMKSGISVCELISIPRHSPSPHKRRKSPHQKRTNKTCLLSLSEGVDIQSGFPMRLEDKM